jgi:hypothetical protein
MNKKELTKAIKYHRENMMLHLEQANECYEDHDSASAMEDTINAAAHAAIFTALSALINK